MPEESRTPIERPALRAQAAMQYQFTLRHILLTIPFMFTFRATGATPMVALLTGLAVALLAGAPWFLPRGVVMDAYTQRGVMLASGAMLFAACGVQALVWRLGLSAHIAGVLTIVCTTVLAFVFLFIEAARPALKWAWQCIQK
jgi:hypothetical protein